MAGDEGFLETAEDHDLADSPLADYGVEGVDNARASAGAGRGDPKPGCDPPDGDPRRALRADGPTRTLLADDDLLWAHSLELPVGYDPSAV